MRQSTRVDRALPAWTTASAAVLLFTLYGLPANDFAETTDESVASVPASTSLPERFQYPTIDVRRDPFVPFDTSSAPVDGSLSGEAPGFVLPPNAGALGGQTGTASGPILRGVVLGLRPSALLEISGRVVLVRPGSPLLGSAVTEIDRRGVLLSDGERLGFSEPRK